MDMEDRKVDTLRVLSILITNMLAQNMVKVQVRMH